MKSYPGYFPTITFAQRTPRILRCRLGALVSRAHRWQRPLCPRPGAPRSAPGVRFAARTRFALAAPVKASARARPVPGFAAVTARALPLAAPPRSKGFCLRVRSPGLPLREALARPRLWRTGTE